MGRRKTQEEFLADLRRIHGDTITTVDRYVGYNNKMEFSCAKCGNTFKSIPGNITQGHGCPYCGGTKKLTQNGFLKKLAKVHGNKVTTSDKYYIPKYKNIKEMVYDYLEHGNIKNICSKYQVSYYSVINNFKSYFGMTRKEYVKLHPEYHIYWGSNSGSFKSISVCCIDEHGTYTRYPSISDASRKTGVSYSSISNCIHGKQKTAGGYRWEYAN